MHQLMLFDLAESFTIRTLLIVNYVYKKNLFSSLQMTNSVYKSVPMKEYDNMDLLTEHDDDGN